MKFLVTTLLLSISIAVSAQDGQLAIDRQVWTKFTKAWEANDANAFNAIHTDDVWRINPGRLLIGDQYKSRNTDRMKGQEKNSIIEFSFESRSINGDNAYEVGYYRITRKDDKQQFVGRFHVALVKVNGAWKITQDWDTDEINGVKLTPESLKNREFMHFQ
ncbi:YybH family protein [Ekhidna sp.]